SPARWDRAQFRETRSATARRVARSGAINWSGTHVQIGRVLMHEVIAMEQVTEQYWKVYFGPLLLGLLDDHTKRVTPVANRAEPRRNRSRKTSPSEAPRPETTAEATRADAHADASAQSQEQS